MAKDIDFFYIWDFWIATNKKMSKYYTFPTINIYVELLGDLQTSWKRLKSELYISDNQYTCRAIGWSSNFTPVKGSRKCKQFYYLL